MFGLGINMDDKTAVAEINEHLKKEFGEIGRMCCEVIYPPVGAYIEVLESSEDCHHSHLPPGRHEVIQFMPGNTSHHLYLKRVDTDERVSVCAGFCFFEKFVVKDSPLPSAFVGFLEERP